MSITRWHDTYEGMEISDDGDWVDYVEYLEETQALRESQEALAREMVELREKLERISLPHGVERDGIFILEGANHDA